MANTIEKVLNLIYKIKTPIYYFYQALTISVLMNANIIFSFRKINRHWNNAHRAFPVPVALNRK